MEAFIVQGFRSPVTRAGKGGLRFKRSDDLAIQVINYLMKHTPQIDPASVDDCIVGCANPEGEQGLQIGRLISMRALGQDVPGMTINRYCASGLEAISIAAAKIKAGYGHIYVAGGTESRITNSPTRPTINLRQIMRWQLKCLIQLLEWV